ncbi:hypothetical protein Pelo_7147 [Pelomyxa schiedti]|nr:hypothetical protein Pelo_7147 [Pelomyxa schiedti]
MSLDMSDNTIGSEGATNITRALESNKSLVSPNLGEILFFWRPKNTLSDALFEIPIEILDSRNRPPRSHPTAMGLATGKEYFVNNFKNSPINSVWTRSVMPATRAKEIPVTSTQTASPSLYSPNLSLPFAQRSSAARKLDTPAQTPETLTSAATATPFQIQTANADQTCFWLESIGVDDDCLKIIRANKLRGKTLANCSVQQLCDLGLVFGDAKFIVEEVKAHLSSQEQSSCSSLKSTVGAESLFSAEMNYKCFAFVVGNQSYGKRSLENAIHDSESICEFLKKRCQFEVVRHTNIPNLEVFDSHFRKFKETLIKQKMAGNKVASIFYFAGHGRQVDGHNFLLMTDDEIAFEETSYDLMELKAPMLGTVIDGMKRYSDLTIGILDACRQSNDKGGSKIRGSEQPTELQLTKEDFRAGCILIYPTSPGRTTQDVCTLPNRRNHGFFTGCFLEVVENAEPGTSWNDLESAIIQIVQRESHDEQTPWISKSSGLRFALF